MVILEVTILPCLPTLPCPNLHDLTPATCLPPFSSLGEEEGRRCHSLPCHPSVPLFCSSTTTCFPTGQGGVPGEDPHTACLPLYTYSFTHYTHTPLFSYPLILTNAPALGNKENMRHAVLLPCWHPLNTCSMLPATCLLLSEEVGGGGGRTAEPLNSHYYWEEGGWRSGHKVADTWWTSFAFCPAATSFPSSTFPTP